MTAMRNRDLRPVATSRVPMILALMIAIASLIACTDGDSGSKPAAAADTPSGFASGQAIDLPQGSEPVELDPADFTTEIDNPYWPMKPGTQWTYREIDEDGAELEVVVVVTNETKEIANGITARVVRDVVSEDGELVEDTKDWYAQDSEGNIWYMGESTAEYEDGKLKTRGGSWEAGVDGALPGIIMPADPQPGMKYRQEYYKGEAEDNGAVLSTEEKAEAAFGQFDNVLLTKDTNALEPDVLEYKLYAKDVGQVLALGISGGADREELLKIDQVSASVGSGPLGSPNL
jgi:hypothetical protein